MTRQEEASQPETLHGRRFYRIAGMVAALLWIASLFPEDHMGIFMLEFGWFAPIMATAAFSQHPFFALSCFGWYANLFFMVFIVQLLLGRYPNFKVATFALCLAATGLLPLPFPNLQESGYNWQSVAGSVTASLWLISFAVVWAVALYARKYRAPYD